MEIKIAKEWVWATIDGNGSLWLWEKQPYFDKEDGTWEQDDGGAFERVKDFLSITFGDDIKDAKDKIWKRNGDDWECAGGQMTEDQAMKSFSKNLAAINGFLGLELSRTSFSPYGEAQDDRPKFVITSFLDTRDKIGAMALKAHNLVQLIKDAEGGKDAS